MFLNLIPKHQLNLSYTFIQPTLKTYEGNSPQISLQEELAYQQYFGAM